MVPEIDHQLVVKRTLTPLELADVGSVHVPDPVDRSRLSRGLVVAIARSRKLSSAVDPDDLERQLALFFGGTPAVKAFDISLVVLPARAFRDREGRHHPRDDLGHALPLDPHDSPGVPRRVEGNHAVKDLLGHNAIGAVPPQALRWCTRQGHVTMWV